MVATDRDRAGTSELDECGTRADKNFSVRSIYLRPGLSRSFTSRKIQLKGAAIPPAGPLDFDPTQSLRIEEQHKSPSYADFTVNLLFWLK